MTWTVYVQWRNTSSFPAVETVGTHPDWPAARRDGLHMVCLAGVRYVTVTGPDGTVVGDWDRYSNRWREYPHLLGPCDNELEPHGQPCPGELYVRPGEPQVRCGACGGWTGTCATTERRNLMIAIGPPVWCAVCDAWQGMHRCATDAATVSPPRAARTTAAYRQA